MSRNPKRQHYSGRRRLSNGEVVTQRLIDELLQEVEDELRHPDWFYHLPKDPTVWDRITLPYHEFRAWLTMLCDNFDKKFVAYTVFGSFLLKGFLAGGGGGGLLALEGIAYMKLRLGASAKTIYQGLSVAAWSLKPIYGLLSDATTLNGYRRSHWIIFSSTMACLGYTMLYRAGAHMSGAMVCLCFFAAKMQVSWTDLMVEATYTEKNRRAPKHASDIVSWVWSGIGVFSIGGVLFAGPLAQYFGPFKSMIFAIPVSAVILVPTYYGWLTEEPVPGAGTGVLWDVLREQRRYFLAGGVLTLGVIVTSTTGFIGVPYIAQAAVAVGVSAALCISNSLLLPWQIARPLNWMFINSCLMINGGFVDNFYLDAANAEQSRATGYPICVNCPHFNTNFYITVVGFCDAIFMTIGAVLFNKVMSKWSYRKAFAVGTVVCMGAGLVDIIQLQRLNTLVGIPDTVFMLGKGALQSTLQMLAAMPSTVLISRLCPKGAESSVFALVAGSSNFGSVISNYLGAASLKVIGMDKIGQGPVDDFSNAWIACLLNAVTPVASLLLLPCLIPDAKMTDNLVLDDSVGTVAAKDDGLPPDPSPGRLVGKGYGIGGPVLLASAASIASAVVLMLSVQLLLMVPLVPVLELDIP